MDWRDSLRSADMLERVVPISEVLRCEEFCIAFASVEDYGESGCVVRYDLDLFRPDLDSLEMISPESGQSIQFSSIDVEFSVRDQTGYMYDTEFDIGSTSFHIENVEFRYAYFSIEPLRPDAEEITIDLTRLIRHTRYNDASPERPMAEEGEDIIEDVWVGPLSVTFSVS